MPGSDPRNPFYPLLLIASVLFVITALGYAVLPELEKVKREQAAAVGQPPVGPRYSPLTDYLVEEGWKWLLGEVFVMVVLGLFSMGLDRLRTLQKSAREAKIPPEHQ